MTRSAWLSVAVLVVAGCSRDLRPDSDDPDLGSDNDTNGDNDTDPDDDTDPDAIVDCRADYQTDDPGSDVTIAECQTGELFCGDFIQATTAGGSTVYDRDIYNAATFGGTDNWDAPERIFYFRQTQDTRVTLWSPCRDLHLFMCLGWECSEEEAVRSGDCNEALVPSDDGGYYRDVPAPTTGVREWEIIVDGRDGDIGNFAISIECD